MGAKTYGQELDFCLGKSFLYIRQSEPVQERLVAGRTEIYEEGVFKAI